MSLDDLQHRDTTKVRGSWWQRWWVAGLLSVMFGLFFLFGFRIYLADDFRAERIAQEQQVLQQLSIIRSRLESYINSDLYQVKGLISLPLASEQIDPVLFNKIAGELAAGDPHILSLQLAPDGIVRYVWPYAEHQGAIGHDLLAAPDRRLAAQRAIDTRSLWVAGPVNLIQGGEAIIGRYPIFVPEGSEERFWGFATILIDWQVVLTETRKAAAGGIEIELGIRGKDGLGSAGEQILGAATVFDHSPLTQQVVLPGGRWEIGGLPRDGWLMEKGYRQLLSWIVGGVVIVLMLGLYTLLRLPVRLRRMVGEATDNLRRSENRLVDAIEAIPDAFVIFDEQDRLVLCNETFRKVYRQSAPAIRYGVTAESLMDYGLQHSQYAPLDVSLDDWRANRIELHQKAEARHEELLADGTVLRVMQRRMRDGGLAGIRVDITDLKRKELELIEARRLAEASNEAKTRFLATISHELRTPLNVVIGVLTALESAADIPEEARQRVLTANSSGKHLLSLVNEILDLSRVESGVLELQPAPFLLDDLINPIISYAQADCDAKGLRFFCDQEEGIPTTLYGDSVRLRQILFNLISNAVKFTHSGQVGLKMQAQRVSEAQVQLMFWVDDSGPGLAAEIKPKLFKAFVQGDASLIRKHSGAGLGLALSQRLARLMDGNIEATDSPLGGARFAVTVKLGCSPCAERVAVPVDPEITLFSRRRILAVDDSPTNQLVIECLLEGTGYELHFADSGPDAIEQVQQRRFDLVLMDISMPEMDGLEATGRIRALLGDDCPVIAAVTAHSMEGDKERYLAQGMDAFITKPVHKQALITLAETLSQ